MLKPYLILALIFSTIFSDLMAQEYSLAQAKEFAVQNHYKLLNADLDKKIAKKKIWETTSIGLPHVGANLSYRNALDLEFEFDDAALLAPGNEFLAVFGADNVSQGKLQVDQLIFDGSYIVGLKASKTYYQLREDQHQKTIQEVKKEVANAYHLVLVAERNVEILSEVVSTLDANVKETKALVENGFLEETELDQLSLMQSKINTNLRNAERNAMISKKMLKLSMGMKLDQELKLTDRLEDMISSTGLAALSEETFNIGGNTDLQILNTQRELAHLDLRRYKMQRLPTIAAYYQYQNTAYQLEFDFYKDASWLDAQNAGVVLNVPLWSSGGQGAKIKQARLELEKVDNTLSYMESALQLQFENIKSKLSAQIANYQDAQKSLEVAEKIYSRALLKQKEGMATSFEVSQLHNQLLEAQGSYINAVFELLNARIELDAIQNKL